MPAIFAGDAIVNNGERGGAATKFSAVFAAYGALLIIQVLSVIAKTAGRLKSYWGERGEISLQNIFAKFIVDISPGSIYTGKLSLTNLK